MIDGSRALAVVAAVTALSAACSSSSSDGRAICGPCPPPVTVAVAAFDRLPGDGQRVRICVGELPCDDFRVQHRRSASSPDVSCDRAGCPIDETGTLHVTLGHRNARTVADLPVRVTASSGGHRLRGAGRMKYTPGTEPCRCEHADARVALA